VVHTAGVLEDALIEGMSAGQLARVLEPKVAGAWHLHELTAELPLSMFVMFSSVAGVLGNPGQGNYAAANVVLDGLAAHRRQLGLPAVSIAWGLWNTATAMTGSLAEAEVARLARSGIGPLTVPQGLSLFDAALAVADPLVVAADWNMASLRSGAESGSLPSVLRGLVRAPRRAAGRPAAGGGLLAQLSVLAEAEAHQLLSDLVRGHVSAVLAASSVDVVDVDRAFSELGFDSMTAVELRNRLGNATGLRLPATLAFDHPTVTALARHLHRTLAPAAPSPEEALRASLEQVQRTLPDHDEVARAKVIALLNSTLARLGAASAAPEGLQDQIDAASDDEIFAFIDTQL